MLNAFLLINCMKKSLDSGFYRLLKRREVVSVTARIVDFGEQKGKLLNGVSEKIDLRHLNLNQKVV